MKNWLIENKNINKKINILLIEDEIFDVHRIEKTIKFYKDRIEIKNIVSNGIDAINLIKQNLDLYDVVILDYQISGKLKGIELIKEIKKIDQSIQIIVITKMTINISDYDFANNLFDAGAFWYCTKFPGDVEDFIYQPTDFIISIFNAYEKRQLEKISNKTKEKLKNNINEILNQKQLIGNSEALHNIKNQIEKYAQSDATILITGESGTGKELVAYNIHYKSKRKYEKFLPINCGSIPQDLIESELFGYEKGSFTGANKSKQGLFEIANNGTIFLDEISELSPSSQVKLLRVLQDGEIEKIGRTDKIKVDVRIITATNKDLYNEVNEGRFREDLFYRLNVIPIFLPSLKERREDIPILIKHFLEVYTNEMEIEIPKINDDAISILQNHNWSGNIRELKNIVQRLVLNFKGEITKENVSEVLFVKNNFNHKDQKDFIQINTNGEILSLKEIDKIFKEKYIKFVRMNSSSDAEAAQKLGLAPPNYHRLCKELGLK
ncbi:MAG: sigma-54 dependent transcriptional regulator [Ignavibacterium sp.]